MQTITSLIAFLSGPISVIFCGRLGKEALATVGLAVSVFNVTGLSVITGLLSAADTLFSQVTLFTGLNKSSNHARDKKCTSSLACNSSMSVVSHRQQRCSKRDSFCYQLDGNPFLGCKFRNLELNIRNLGKETVPL